MQEYQGKVLPVLPLRGLTAFPKMMLHFDVGRSMSIKALEKAMKEKQEIFLSAQDKISYETPKFENLYRIGTVCEIKQILKLQSSEGVRVLVEGLYRATIIDEVKDKPYFVAEVVELGDVEIDIKNEQEKAILRKLIENFEAYFDVQPKISKDLVLAVLEYENPFTLADFIAQNIPIDNAKKQSILEQLHPIKRAMQLLDILQTEIDILRLEENIQAKVKSNIDKNQRDYFLKEQLKVLLDELGEGENLYTEYEDICNKILSLKIDDKSVEKLLKEAKKMRRLGINSQEGSVIRNYLDFALNLPFNKSTKDKNSIEKAEKILNTDHYGLKKVKERILETLALRQISGDTKGVAICLVGPPGVGKTSIAASIAKALGRNMARVSLGGVRDEAEIRGHRKTYVGAMSGKIIKAFEHAKSNNPLVLLDEIDKMSSDMRGDPASAMLEVLDFNQNNTFMDHYLEIPFDISKTIFVATANNLQAISKPLLDRMEIIDLSSYTTVEKFHIARDHIIPKCIKKYNLKRIKFTDEAIYAIIKGYTKEAGVRRLEQKVEKILRKLSLEFVKNGVKAITITEDLTKYLGKVIFTSENLSKRDEIGVVNGLAYTTVGGEILKVEVNVLSGDGKIQLTGNLGNVMKESANIAISYIRSIQQTLNIEQDFYKKYDIHIHFPEGAVPKDGPSAGITMATAIISALTGRKVRHDIAMTGEISLRGNVLPIGGLFEKSMAAYQNGIKQVIISRENEKDLAELDTEVLANVEFIIVDTMKDVLKYALISEDIKEIKLMAHEILNETVVSQ